MTSTLITPRRAEAPSPQPRSPQPSAPPAPSMAAPRRSRQSIWQRVIVLLVLGYEGVGALLGGALLVAAPDGRLMDMPVEVMHGFFPDFLIPGMILIALGILNIAAFVAVWRRARTDWFFAGLALGSLAMWFMVEIAILGQLHWLHVMWGLPVVVGALMALPLIPSSRVLENLSSTPTRC